MIDFLATNPTARIASLIGLFAIVVLLTLFVMQELVRRANVRRDLRAISSGSPSSGPVSTLHGKNDDAWTRLVDRIEKVGLSLADTKSDELRVKLVAAGFDSQSAPRMYTLIRLLLIIALPSLFILLMLASGSQLSGLKLYIIASVAAVMGLMLPTLFVRARADRRREDILHGFPDALDLLLVCVEAGLSLEAGLDRVGREMAHTHPLISNLLVTATLQLRAGASREMALRQMADVAGTEEIGSFATLLIQSGKLGASVGDTLRMYSAEMREKRRMRAEEKAHRIPVLISVPLVACMLPVMIGVLMLPAAIRVIRQMLPSLAGG